MISIKKAPLANGEILVIVIGVPDTVGPFAFASLLHFTINLFSVFVCKAFKIVCKVGYQCK